MKYHENRRGYVRCEITPDAWHADYRHVPFVMAPGAPVVTAASFTVEPGRPGAERV
jgi:alkaline phosphatase D